MGAILLLNAWYFIIQNQCIEQIGYYFLQCLIRIFWNLINYIAELHV